MSRQENIIYSKEVIEFTAIANEFCKLTESLHAQNRKDFIHNAYKLLTLLQSKTVLLPEIKLQSEYESESFVNEADWHFIDTSISEKLGSLELYSDLREPANPDTSSEVTISECLADTYQDLKDFTQIYQFGNPEAILQALSECITSFEQYWGPRIMIVIREFHLLLHGDADLEESTKEENRSSDQNKNWLDDIFKN